MKQYEIQMLVFPDGWEAVQTESTEQEAISQMKELELKEPGMYRIVTVHKSDSRLVNLFIPRT